MRLAVFASGGGSNFQAIVDARRTGLSGIEVVLCVTNNPNAGVLDRAKSEGIPTLVISSASYQNPSDFSSALLLALNEADVEIIALAGYMRKIPVALITAFPGKILNIHPSLLPAFGGKGMYGRRVHEAVLDSGATHTGATVHVVDEDYDTGRIVLQKNVPVLPGDTPVTLAARVLEAEHQLFPDAINLVLLDQLQT